MKTLMRTLQISNLRPIYGLMLLGATLAASLQANVNTIAIYNTGVGPGGLITPGLQDPSYTVVSAPGAPTNTTTLVDLTSAFPFGYWAPDSATSQWISLFPGNTQAGGSQYSEPAGQYVYQTTFFLPADATLAQLSGVWGTDNTGISVTLNGNSLGGTLPTGFNPFPQGTFSSTPTSYFVLGGVNTLDFTVFKLHRSSREIRKGLEKKSGTYVPEPGF